MRREEKDDDRPIIIALCIIAIVLIIVIGTFIFVKNYYEPSNETTVEEDTETNQEYASMDDFKEISPESIPGFLPVPGHENLVYSEETQTVYHLTLIQEGGGKYATSYTIMAPYIDNGHYYECQNGELVEMVP